MISPGAVIFDLGGTLMDPDLEGGAEAYWGRCYHYLLEVLPEGTGEPLVFSREDFVSAMVAAEEEHWRKVNEYCWSGSPAVLIEVGLERLGISPLRENVAAVLDGCGVALSARFLSSSPS